MSDKTAETMEYLRQRIPCLAQEGETTLLHRIETFYGALDIVLRVGDDGRTTVYVDEMHAYTTEEYSQSRCLLPSPTTPENAVKRVLDTVRRRRAAAVESIDAFLSPYENTARTSCAVENVTNPPRSADLYVHMCSLAGVHEETEAGDGEPLMHVGPMSEHDKERLRALAAEYGKDPHIQMYESRQPSVVVVTGIRGIANPTPPGYDPSCGTCGGYGELQCPRCCYDSSHTCTLCAGDGVVCCRCGEKLEKKPRYSLLGATLHQSYTGAMLTTGIVVKAVAYTAEEAKALTTTEIIEKCGGTCLWIDLTTGQAATDV